jgi:hypothetical protein
LAKKVQAIGEESPRDKSGVGENWIGKAIRGDLSQFSKKNTENHHGEKRLDNGPGRAKHSLLVADPDISPGHEVQKFTVLPQLFELE